MNDGGIYRKMTRLGRWRCSNTSIFLVMVYGGKMEKEFEVEESTAMKAPENETEDVFMVKEVEVEEMAIDGICGVY